MYTSFKFNKKNFEEIHVFSLRDSFDFTTNISSPFRKIYIYIYIYMHSQNALLKFQICTIVNKRKRFYNHDEQKENYIILI